MNPSPTRIPTLPTLIAIACLAASSLRAGDAANPHDAARTPGAEHLTLASLAGSYELTSTFWPEPTAPPETSKLPARRELVLGGRALRLEVGPDAGGFRGTGLMGFDNVAGSFWYAWTDTSTTGLANLTGSLDAHGAGSLEGSMPTPFGPTRLRVEIRFEGTEEIHDYFVPDATDADVRLLELRYRRTAAAD